MPHGLFASDAELWAELEPALAAAPATARKRLRARMPPCRPYTFTHGDLNINNVMVDVVKNTVTAVLDWELSGYFPVWWEYASTMAWAFNQDNLDWRLLLREYMEPFEDTREWWLDFMSLQSHPKMIDERAAALLGDDADGE